jgi:hypothetical protein
MDPKIAAALSRIEDAVNALALDLVAHSHGKLGEVVFRASEPDYVLDLSDLIGEGIGGTDPD